jgi:hypothetical protein
MIGNSYAWANDLITWGQFFKKDFRAYGKSSHLREKFVPVRQVHA